LQANDLILVANRVFELITLFSFHHIAFNTYRNNAICQYGEQKEEAQARLPETSFANH
jgi:hypothetical protein